MRWLGPRKEETQAYCSSLWVMITYSSSPSCNRPSPWTRLLTATATPPLTPGRMRASMATLRGVFMRSESFCEGGPDSSHDGVPVE
jgi:hypothetical protein